MSSLLHNARVIGQVCAVAGQSQREMRGWAVDYAGLYKADAFDPAMFSTLALAAAFSGPQLDAAQLRMANKACLWCFGLDWLVDCAAETQASVDEIVANVLAVADGAAPLPGDDLTVFLAHIRDQLRAEPTFARLGPVWLDELRLMLDAMAREWAWKSSGGLPGFEEYLANADNLGFSFVFSAHWLVNGGDGDVAAVREASWAVQRVIRLLNDLGTVERDRKWGDLNALLLGVEKARVESRIVELVAEAERLLAPLPQLHGDYMRRQMEFCSGFYGVTDFWGES